MRLALKDKDRFAWRLSAPLATAVFLGAALLHSPTLGLEPDELLYVRANMRPLDTLTHIRIGHEVYPLMIMNYLGALRSWLYRPIEAATKPWWRTTHEHGAMRIQTGQPSIPRSWIHASRSGISAAFSTSTPTSAS